MKFRLENIEKEFRKLKLTRDQRTMEQSNRIVENLVTELKEATPIDTGLARDSWVTKKTEEGIDISNTTDYIQYLNAGSSKQAPKHFIEKTALQYGDPVGTIVEVRDK